MITLKFKLLSDGIDLGFRSFRLSNVSKNIQRIINGIISFGIAIWAFIPGTHAANSTNGPDIDTNLCPEPMPNIYHENSDSKDVVAYQTNTGSSYILTSINTESMWRKILIDREIKIVEHEVKVGKSSRFTVNDLQKLLAKQTAKLPILTAALQQITAPLILEELKAIMAKQNINLPMSFKALTQCARDIIPQACGAILSTPHASSYNNITGLLPSPAIVRACNVSALSLAEGHQRDEQFEQCVATKLQEALNPVSTKFINEFLNLRPSISSAVSVGLLLGLVIAISKTIFFDVPKIKQQIRDNFLNRKIPNPHLAKLNEIGFDGEVPDEFTCAITHLIMHDPVRAADGKIYERNAIEKWFVASGTKRPPMSFNVMQRNDRLESVPDLAERIKAFVAEKVAAAPSVPASSAAAGSAPLRLRPH